VVRSSARLICLVRARDVALKPDFAEAFYNRGFVLGKLKRFDEGFRKVWLEGNRFVVARQRLIEALEFTQGIASVVERVGIAGLEGDRLIKARQRLVEALEFTQGIASVAKGASVS
jgi:hypothetical protein